MFSIKLAEDGAGKDMKNDTKSELDHEYKNFLKGKLDFLLDKAPSDSSLSHQISKIKKGYEGAIEIISSQGQFLAKAFHHDPNILAFDLVEDIYRQILSWRTKRSLLLQ